jgi:hypothetical protein
MATRPARAEKEDAVRSVGAEEIFSALQRTDRCCRLLVKYLRESHPKILEAEDFNDLQKLTRRQMRENRELLGTGPAAKA